MGTDPAKRLRIVLTEFGPLTIHYAHQNALRTVCGRWIDHDSPDGTGTLCKDCVYWREHRTVQYMNLEELQKKYPDAEWRYLGMRPTVKHALTRGIYDSQIHSNSIALCQRSPAWFSGWSGTGNQSEYDKLDQLRECYDCINILEGRGRGDRVK